LNNAMRGLGSAQRRHNPEPPKVVSGASSI
jgi:hypothetical protein